MDLNLNPIETLEGELLILKINYKKFGINRIELPIAKENYTLSLTWDNRLDIFHLTIHTGYGFENAVPDKYYKLLSFINEHISLGHFEISSEENEIRYRHSLKDISQLCYDKKNFLIKASIERTLIEMGLYYDVFEKLSSGEKTALEVFKEVFPSFKSTVQ